MVGRILKTVSILLFFLKIAFAQNFYNGDTFNYFITDGIDGTNDESKMISLNGTWIISGENERTIRVPFSYDGNNNLLLKRSFRIPSHLKNDNFKLVCYGIGQSATVRLNQEFLALVDGMNKISIDVPKNQIYPDQENILEIEIKPDIPNPLDYPLAASFYTPKRYSGIYRDIYLISLPEKRIESISLNGKWLNNSGKLFLSYLVRDTKLALSNVNQSISSNLYKLNLTVLSDRNEILSSTVLPVSFSSGSVQSGQYETTIPYTEEWRPDKPSLYRVRLALQVNDTIYHKIETILGFKNIKLTSKGINTSNNVYQIRGAIYVEEYPESGWSATQLQLENDIANAKLLGLNTLRIIGKPPHPYLYSLADRYGIWLLIEPPLFLPPAKVLKQSGFRQHIIATIRDMVNDAEHHPSLLAAGTGFGIPIVNNESELIELYRQLKLETQIPLYLSSPVQNTNIPYDLFLYETLPHHSIEMDKTLQSSQPTLFSSIGLYVDPLTIQGTSPEAEMRQSQMTIQSLQLPIIQRSSGFILSALNDYHTNYPLLLRTPSPAPFLVTNGIWSYHRVPRAIFTPLRDHLEGIKIRTIPVPLTKPEPPPHFIIFTLLILAIVAITFGRNKLLRMHIVRTFMNTTRFWEDVREGRYFQYGESVVIIILYSATTAVLAAATIHGMKNDFNFDVLLTSALHGLPKVKVFVNKMIWDPTLIILFLFVSFITIAFLISGLTALLSLFTRQRMTFQKAMSYLAWSFSNHILLIPLALFLINSLAVESVSFIWIFLAFITFLWSIIRLSSAIMVAFRNTAIVALVTFTILNVTAIILVYHWLWNQKNIGLFWSSFRLAGW